MKKTEDNVVNTEGKLKQKTREIETSRALEDANSKPQPKPNDKEKLLAMTQTLVEAVEFAKGFVTDRHIGGGFVTRFEKDCFVSQIDMRVTNYIQKYGKLELPPQPQQ